MSGLHFDAWAAATPNGTSLGELTQAYAKSYRGVHQGMGFGQFTINRHDAQSAWAATGNLIRVRRVTGGPFAYDSANYIGAFWIEGGDDKLLSPDEEGGEDLTRGGRTGEACLEGAVLYPDAFDPRNDRFTTKTRIDGNWHIDDRTAGEVLAIFLRDLNERTPDPLAFVSKDFGLSLDTNDVVWTDTDTKWQIPVGINGLQLLETCVSGGLFYRVSPDFAFHAYETEPGDDLTATVTITKGVDLVEGAERQVYARTTISRALVQGTKENGKLKYREVVNSTIESALPRRREGFVEFRRTPTNNKLDKAGNRYISKMKRRHDGATSARVVETTGQEAFTDYVPGDLVTLDIPGIYEAVSTRVYAIVLEEDEAGNVDPVIEFEQSPFDPATNRDGDFEEGRGGNGSDGGTNCGDCPPIPPYTPPGTDAPLATGMIVSAENWPTGSVVRAWVEADGVEVMDNATCIAYNSLLYTFPTPIRASVWRIHFQIDWTTVFMPQTLMSRTVLLNEDGTADLLGNGWTPGATSLAGVTSNSTQTYEFSGPSDGFSMFGYIGGVLTGNNYGSVTLDQTFTPSQKWGIAQTDIINNVVREMHYYATWTLAGETVEDGGPLEGQGHTEETAGDGTTTAYTTNYPYAPGSLEVHVNGVLWPVTETDSEAGTFTFASAPPDGAVIIVTYQNAGTTATGATNTVPVASTPTTVDSLTLDDLTDVNAPTPADGEVLTWDDYLGQWEPATASEPTADAHLTDATDAHDASAVSVLDTAVNFTGDNVEAVLAELQDNIDALALDDLADVLAPTPADGEVLAWDDYLQMWVPAPAGGSLTLDELTDVNAPSPSDGQVLTWDSTPGEWVAAAGGASTTGTINVVIDGGGSAISTGIKADLVLDFAGTIEAATLLADQSGSIVVDVWLDTYANFPPTVADSITASAKPTLSSAAKSQDSTLTGWATAFSAGDVLRFNVDSASTVTRVVLSLKYSRS